MAAAVVFSMKKGLHRRAPVSSLKKYARHSATKMPSTSSCNTMSRKLARAATLMTITLRKVVMRMKAMIHTALGIPGNCADR